MEKYLLCRDDNTLIVRVDHSVEIRATGTR